LPSEELALARSAIDVIGPAFEHTKQQLLKPFNLGQWGRIALLAMATGEMSSGGGCNSFHFPSTFPTHRAQSNFVGPADLLKGIDPALVGTLLMVAMFGGIVLLVVWVYVSSISRFVLYDTVVRRHCDMAPAWDRWHSQGMRFFWWQLVLMVFSLGLTALLLFPLIVPLIQVIKSQGNVSPSFFLAFIPFLGLFFVFWLCMMLIVVLTKDFVVPVMAVDGVGVIEGWRRLIAMMGADPGNYAGYIGMKIVLAIGAGIVFSIVTGIVVVILMIPGAIIGVAVALFAKSAGFAWNAMTITIAVVVGILLFGALLYLVAFLCVPVAIFFPAYALYFLADRYPGLYAQLYGAPVTPTPAWTPAFPTPAPIG
jgi:hypothetical protein